MLSHADPSLRYVAAANRAPHDPSRAAAIEAVAPLVTDWDAVLTLGEQHRVMPLLADALRTTAVPSAIRERARVATLALAHRSLFQMGEVIRIGAALDAAGIDWLTFKGPALAIQAFGDVCAKMSHDLDLLIPLSDAPGAFECMRALGYRRVDGPGKADPGAFVQYFKDSLWRRSGAGSLVELHTRFFETAELLPGFGLESPREQVTIGGYRSLPTLARPELLVYLAVHGARSSWYRLKWIADFAALTAKSEARDIDAARARAASAGVIDMLDSALLLANGIFASPLPMQTRAQQDTRRVRMLVRAAVRELSAPCAQTQRNPHWRPSFVQYLGPIRASGSWKYRFAELRRLLADPVGIEWGAAPGWRRWSSPARVLFRFTVRMAARIAKMGR